MYQKINTRKYKITVPDSVHSRSIRQCVAHEAEEFEWIIKTGYCLRPIALENLLVELRKRTFRGKPLQEATVQKYLSVVSAVLK